MAQSNLNVLIVDDDCETRDMLGAALFSQGFHPVAAEDGLEALHLLRAVRRRTPEAPCLVLLDLSMPRLGGYEFRRVQLSDPRVADVPVAVVSGAADLQQLARAMGAVAALEKPIDFERLLTVVRKYCVSEPAASRSAAHRLPHDRRQHGA
jgi:CheY-like chemotaxis protein